MPHRMSLALAALTTALAIAAPGATAAPVAGHFCLVLDTPSSIANISQTARRNSYVVLQPWEVQQATQLKAANPELSVLVYQNLSAVASTTGPGGLTSTGVSYAEAIAQSPEWVLRDTAGARVAESGYPWLWMADIGNTGYQRQWTANVLRLLDTGPWDGVFLDGVNATAKYDAGARKLVDYPTDAAYEKAMRSMLAYAGPQITGAGKLAIANMGSWNEFPAVVAEWLPYVSGAMDEQFVKWSATSSNAYSGPSSWQAQIEAIEATERMGKQFLAVIQTNPSNAQALRYGWASALMGANGGHTSFFAANAYDGDTWSDEYEVPLGEPLAAAYPIGDGAWERRFEDGLVLVNPSSTSVKVTFGGSYSGSGLADASGSTLASHTALILTPAAPVSAGVPPTPLVPEATYDPVGETTAATAAPAEASAAGPATDEGGSPATSPQSTTASKQHLRSFKQHRPPTHCPSSRRARRSSRCRRSSHGKHDRHDSPHHAAK
jgi:hypothetical protein